MDVSPLLLGDVCLRAVHGLHVLPEGAGVCVALCAARDLAHIWFLTRHKTHPYQILFHVGFLKNSLETAGVTVICFHSEFVT